MRNFQLSITVMTLAAGGVAVGGLVAGTTPAMAFTTYEVTPSQAAASHLVAEDEKPVFSIETSSGTSDGFYFNRNGNRNSWNSKEAPSREMGWQGTGYYLRPDK